jgi:hypothetical protein
MGLTLNLLVRIAARVLMQIRLRWLYRRSLQIRRAIGSIDDAIDAAAYQRTLFLAEAKALDKRAEALHAQLQ